MGAGTEKNNTGRILLTALVLTLCEWSVAAGPETIAIHGTLTTAGGEPATGEFAYRLQFWDAATDGTQIGADIDGVITVSPEGRFTIAVVPNQEVLAQTAVWYALYLDTDNGGIDEADLFGGRTQIHAVPFARVAQDSDKLGGIEPGSFVSDTEMETGLAQKANTQHAHAAAEITSGVFPDERVADALTITSSGSVNAEAITAGTLPDARLSPGVTVQGNNFNEAGQLVRLDASKRLPPVDGSQLLAVGGGVPAGAILLWWGAADTIPSGWLLCDGTNGTPDLRARFVVGAGNEYSTGSSGGEKEHTLTVAEMPSHAHGGVVRSSGGYQGYTYAPPYSSGSSDAAGGGQPHNNLPPYYALYYIMKAPE